MCWGTKVSFVSDTETYHWWISICAGYKHHERFLFASDHSDGHMIAIRLMNVNITNISPFPSRIGDPIPTIVQFPNCCATTILLCNGYRHIISSVVGDRPNTNLRDDVKVMYLSVQGIDKNALMRNQVEVCVWMAVYFVAQ